MSALINWDDFEKIDIRVGTVLTAEEFPEARKPAYKLTIDFGEEYGIKNSSAQITKRYSTSDLKGKQVLAVLNFPPMQIGPFKSECLVMGTYSSNGVVLLTTDLPVKNGDKIG